MGRYAGQPMSSLGRSVAAYQPYYAPPVAPQTVYIRGSSPFATGLDVPSSTNRSGAPVVVRKFRTAGMRFLYSRGAQAKKWFRERATGAVESTSFQPVESRTTFAAFNDGLYRAGGYPRNLGLSEKVPTIPPMALGTAPWQMAPRPRITRNVFTNRSFTGAKSVPAKPTNGRYS